MGVVDPFSVARAAGLELTGKSEGLTLTDGTMELRADFGRMLPRLKQGRLQQELLVKAARAKGVEHPWAVDATAGFGEDSLLLAAAGFTVDLYEQDCVIDPILPSPSPLPPSPTPTPPLCPFLVCRASL